LVPEEEILKWCDKEPIIRYPIIAGLITISKNASQTGQQKNNDQSGRQQWTNVALRLLQSAPDKPAVLREFISQLEHPGSYWGSRASVLESNTAILEELLSYPDPTVVKYVTSEKTRIQEMIDAERRSEDSHDRMRDERFE
jgi:hypothetical protein